MGDGHEMLAAILHPFDWASEPARRECAEEILRIKFAPRPETAADVVFHIVDRRLRQLHHGREDTAVEERRVCTPPPRAARAHPLAHAPPPFPPTRRLAPHPRS